MPRSQPLFEEVDGLRVPLGGLNGYIGVRGKQGRKKDKFQGVTPKKKHRTDLYNTAQEAAVAFARLRKKIALGMVEPHSQKKTKSVATTGALRKLELGIFLGHLLQQQRAVVPIVRGVLLTRQQAAAAAARGVAVAFADPAA